MEESSHQIIETYNNFHFLCSLIINKIHSRSYEDKNIKMRFPKVGLEL